MQETESEKAGSEEVEPKDETSEPEGEGQPEASEPEKAKAGGKREEKGVFNLYQIEGEGLKRLRPFCERCGSGYFMADHGTRFTCGHCGFTRYKQNQD